MQTLQAVIDIPIEKAIRLKFERRLDTYVIDILASKLLKKLIDSKCIEIIKYDQLDEQYHNAKSLIRYIAAINVESPKKH